MRQLSKEMWQGPRQGRTVSYQPEADTWQEVCNIKPINWHQIPGNEKLWSEWFASGSRDFGAASRRVHLHPGGEDRWQRRCDCHLLVLLPRPCCPWGHCSRENLLRNLLDKNWVIGVKMPIVFTDYECYSVCSRVFHNCIFSKKNKCIAVRTSPGCI